MMMTLWCILSGHARETACTAKTIFWVDREKCGACDKTSQPSNVLPCNITYRIIRTRRIRYCGAFHCGMYGSMRFYFACMCTSLLIIVAECKITAGHWPISDHFSKMVDQNFSMVHWHCIHFVHMANQIHEELEKWPTICYWTLIWLYNFRQGWGCTKRLCGGMISQRSLAI